MKSKQSTYEEPREDKMKKESDKLRKDKVAADTKAKLEYKLANKNSKGKTKKILDPAAIALAKKQAKVDADEDKGFLRGI